MRKLIKRKLSHFLASPIFGIIISAFRNEISYYGTRISTKNPSLSHTKKAAIFWKLYESAEARLISKYLDDRYPIIELGASLGIISTLISSKSPQPIWCVEANPMLILSIQYNLDFIGKENYTTIHAGVTYSDQPVHFVGSVLDNLYGKLNSENGLAISKITLSEIIFQNNIQDYILVADIEGSEIEIFLFDTNSLDRCQFIFIELHQTEFQKKLYTVEDQMHLIEKNGFALVKRDGNCVVYKRMESKIKGI